MKVDNKIFHFPPYISTKWSLVSSLHVEESTLTVTLNNGKAIAIPQLSPEQINVIFSAHEKYLEKPVQEKVIQKEEILSNYLGKSDRPFQMEIANLEEIGSVMQHNPSQMHAPNLPSEMLDKISGLAHLFSPDDTNLFPQPEPHCNCPHCQIARAIHESAEQKIGEKAIPTEEEKVSDADLQFQQWEITYSQDKLYTVTDKINPEETYTVHLGDPVGCTCGKQGCEHLITVLRN